MAKSIFLPRCFAACIALVTCLSCINSMGGGEGEQRISGIYTLERVDGVLVPTEIQPQEGCNRMVREGLLTLAPGRQSLLPHYTWSITIDVDCQPIPPGVFQGTDDVGSWFYRPTELPFTSRKDLGTYTVDLDETSGVPEVTVLHLGNAYQFRRTQ